MDAWVKGCLPCAGKDWPVLPPHTFITAVEGQYRADGEAGVNVTGNCTTFVRLNHTNHYGICDFVDPPSSHQVRGPPVLA